MAKEEAPFGRRGNLTPLWNSSIRRGNIRTGIASIRLDIGARTNLSLIGSHLEAEATEHMLTALMVHQSLTIINLPRIKVAFMI